MADELAIVPVENHRFSRDVLEVGSRLAKSAPEQVTDLHLQHLAHYVSDRELTDIVRRRAEAIDRRAHEEDEALAIQTARANDEWRVARAPATPPIDAAALEGITSFEELCEKFPDQLVTLGLFGQFHAFVMQINEKNKERNTKIAALEQRAADLTKQLADLRVEMDALIQVRS